MVRKRSEKKGLPPGSLVSVSDETNSNTVMKVFSYNNESYEELTATRFEDLPDTGDGKVTWIDADGLADVELIKALGERFGLHALLLEDILNTEHRPTIEEFQDHLFVVAKMLSIDPVSNHLEVEQISFVIGKDYVLSLQEHPGDILDPVRERLRNGLGRLRRKGPDYLLYALLDVIVDNYFTIVDGIGDRIERLENKVLSKPNDKSLMELQELRGLLITINRFVLPTRELAGRFSTIQTSLIDKGTRRYVSDLQDHTVYIAESIGMFRDMLSNLENTYHAQLNARLAQVMKLLTVISTIFIPLTFIVGVYGMNFKYMPELEAPMGYPIVLSVMFVLSLAMLYWFRWIGWL